jgi:hypothetical protein
MNPAEPPAAIPHTLRIFKAEALSRQGLHREAEALLGGVANPPDDPVLLHALATVVTRQGDHERSRRLWRLLQTRQPGHREAERMLLAIETWEERPAWVRFAPAGAAALLVLGLAIWALFSPGQSRREPSATAATPVAPLPASTRVTAVAPLPVVTPAPYPPSTEPAAPEAAPVVLFRVAPAKPAKPAKK